MKKLLAKIIGATTALAMAIGVGIGISNNVKKAEPVYATTTDLDFDLTSNPGGWPTTNSTTETDYNYSLNDVDYTFTTNNIKCNSGYLMCTSTAALGLPALSGKKLITVVAYNSGGCSISTRVGISSSGSSASYVSGGSYQTWSTTSSNYTYNLSGTSANTRYYLYVTNKNAQITRLVLTYEHVSSSSYSVSYNANGGSGTMTDSNSPYASGATVTVLANAFTRSNYSFDCWNTRADGNGTDYDPSDTFTINDNITLYAQWIDNSTYAITYNANNATSGSVPEDDNNYSNGSSVEILGNSGNLVKTGKVWSGWNTRADGTGVSYSEGDDFAISMDTTLYARWIDDYSTASNLIITADYLNLDTTGITSAAVLNSIDGMQYKAAPTSSASVKATSIQNPSTNVFNSLEKPIMIGKTNAYLYNNDAFQKNINKIELFANSGASTAVSVDVNFSSSAPCTNYEENDPVVLETTNSTYTFNPTVANAKYFRLQITNDKNAQVQIKITFATPTTSVTVAPKSVTLAPNEEQQLTPTVLPANNTDSLTYESGDESIATVSDSGLITAVDDGTTTITVTSGSCSDTCEVTVETPVTPFITVAEESIDDAYTGQNDLILFTYGNLINGSPTVSSDDEDVAIISDFDCDGSSGLVQIDYVGAGSATISFKDGSTVLDSLSVTVIVSTVTIEGMPVSKLMSNDTTLDLGALVTVTPVGSCTDDITWSSSASAVASVDEFGVVTANKPGTAVITVTPDTYQVGAETCTVTVTNEKAILAKSIAVGDIVYLGSSDTNAQYNGPSGTGVDAFGTYVAYNEAPAIDVYALEICAGSAEGKYAFKITSGTYADYYLGWSGSKNSLKITNTLNDNSSWTVAIDGSGNATISNVANSERVIWWNVDTPRFACYTDKTDDEHYNKVQLWKYATPNSYLGSASMVKTVHGHENYTADVLTSVDSVALRFGARIAKNKWNAIKENWDISDYGVMLMKAADLTAGSYSSIEDAYIKGASSSVLKILNKCINDTPYADPYEDGDDYLFTVKVNFIDDEHYEDVIYAAPFVVVSGQYYFLGQMNTSVKALANSYVGTGYSYLSDAALTLLGA